MARPLPSIGLAPLPACWLSETKISSEPSSDRTMPASRNRFGTSRNSRNEAMPIQSGLVVTSEADEATEVYSSEVIQVPKCAARHRPAASASPSWRRVSSGPAPWRRKVPARPSQGSSTSGVTSSAASPSRQAATASDGICAAWA